MEKSRLLWAAVVIVGVASTLASASAIAQGGDIGVTGAAQATFPAGSGANFNGIPLSGLTLGQGVSIGADGSARGQFQVALQGISLIGQAQEILVEGEVSSGGPVLGDGSVSFSGIATVDMGDGTLPLPGVPFFVTASPGSLALILDTVTLPTATVTAGSITIE